MARNADYLEFDEAIIQEYLITFLNRLWKIWQIHGNTVSITLNFVNGKGKLIPSPQFHRFFFKISYPNFGTGQVGQNSHISTRVERKPRVYLLITSLWSAKSP